MSEKLVSDQGTMNDMMGFWCEGITIYCVWNNETWQVMEHRMEMFHNCIRHGARYQYITPEIAKQPIFFLSGDNYE